MRCEYNNKKNITIMKTVFNVILGVCALVLAYVCYASIMAPINFEKAKTHRDDAVIARLIDIR